MRFLFASVSVPAWSLHTNVTTLKHSAFTTWFRILPSDALSVPLEMAVNKQNAWQLSVCVCAGAHVNW